MISGPRAYLSRISLAIVLMVMMGFGSATADIHPVDTIDAECASVDLATQIIDLESRDDEETPDHEHHAHNCGSCHFHVVGTGLSSSMPGRLNNGILRPRGGESALLAEPMGLYRPPRA
tara:strand:- start:583 stop:939 length:357 start_codon:yes stop_codon:yes gene_type:complete